MGFPATWAKVHLFRFVLAGPRSVHGECEPPICVPVIGKAKAEDGEARIITATPAAMVLIVFI